ncbi:hypothetical protein EHP00_95 [Ecytonucleospora hepatopenaei]|uniref:Uncharacterized protein n=1 Tax=Ecytonucleospora hepatopenaei TaxID=646526 RepID=A0A1W0E5R2_9MICR|nr:hypothetical protein EHP00_95 [Ecytonucleospora hepatopenaei]
MQRNTKQRNMWLILKKVRQDLKRSQNKEKEKRKKQSSGKFLPHFKMNSKDMNLLDENIVSEYVCITCKTEIKITPKDPIRCSNCGKHILCKKREPKNTIQLKAI